MITWCGRCRNCNKRWDDSKGKAVAWPQAASRKSRAGVGNILTWRQQADQDAVLWRYGYDQADQLTSAIKHATDPQETILKRYFYTYDPAGNRTSEQIDDSVTTDSHDVLNRLMSQTPGGALMFRGHLDEAGTVTINGKPATVFADNRFEGTATVTSGTNTVTIVATDTSNNQTAHVYEVDIAGSAKTFTYDANGNMTSDGSRTFEWDARNQLVAVSVGTHRSEFTYDGLQRRVRVIDQNDGTIETDRRMLRCNTETCEERNTETGAVRRAFTNGEQIDGATRMLLVDHLNSVRELTDGSATVIARYAFDPWGRRTVTTGSDLTTVSFTGHYGHAHAGVLLAQYRIYDVEFGRWLSRDPLFDDPRETDVSSLLAGPLGFGLSGTRDGLNAYAYLLNNPINQVDPLGLQARPPKGPYSGTKAGIEKAWKGCLNKGDELVYTGESKFHPNTGLSRWIDWKADFGKKCRAGAGPGKIRYSTCSSSVNFKGAAWCSCCETECK